MYNRRIICDIDDTISRTINRDFERAEPIKPVIDKINYLYDNGWEIWLFTARGYLSCNGDREVAEGKYKKQINVWLSKHNVKYHKLSFQKELATYYIDDKSLKPEEFIDLNIEIMKNGWSGALVEKRNDKIYKTHDDSLEAAKWYDLAKSWFNVPKVYSLIGKTICLEYIDHDNSINIDKVIDIICKFKDIPYYSKFETYIERMKVHFEVANDYWFLVDELKKIEHFCQISVSFCHGDLSLENILNKNGDLYLIDPIYKPNFYSSYLLDATKLLHSYRKYGKMVEFNYLKDKLIDILDIPKNVLILLEITQWIRVLKYMNDLILKNKFKKIIQGLIDDL